MFGFRKTLPGNGRKVTSWVYDADIHAQRIASLGAYTNTMSPGSYGLHGRADASPSGYTGDPGYGVNRWAGETQPMQSFYSAVAPLMHPKSRRLGIGAGVSGQPGLPSTGAGNDPGLGLNYGAGLGWGS